MSDVEAAVAPRKNPWPGRVVRVLVAVVVGLVIAEGAFWWRDDGAFPHVNFYVADAALGARLLPHASERLAFGGNPTTTIHTNALGYRAHAGSAEGEWPAENADTDLLVVGDSQVFGLGVQGEQTFSAHLAMQTGRTVLNAGVPTYGPQEYAAVVDEVLKIRKVKRVVFVVNMANDLFELQRNNTERHVIWDGWAVRKETAPSTLPTSWPGRQWLFSQSHLVFAARGAWLAMQGKREAVGPELDERAQARTSLPSEGHWTDLIDTAATTTKARELLPTPVVAKDPRHAAEGTIRDLEHSIYERAYQKYAEEIWPAGSNQVEEEATLIAERQGRPDDIVVNTYAESGREIAETATALLAGAIVKKRNFAALKDAAKRKKDTALLALFDSLTAAQAAYEIAAGETSLTTTTAPLSPLGRVLAGVKRRCDDVGAKLVVVALPLDVMVSAEEWKKYDAPPKDMSPTRVLIESVLQDAEAVGAVGVDVSAALKAAEPGAFLDRDLHMTPKGHAAFAAALAPALTVLPTLKPPAPGLPQGRSAVPSAWEWERSTERVVKGSSAAGCETKQIREWLKVTCLKGKEWAPAGVEVVAGGEGDAHGISGGDTAVVLAPVVVGKNVRARFYWQTHTQDLIVQWPADAEQATVQFEARQPKSTPPVVSDVDQAQILRHLCEDIGGPRPYCGLMYGATEPGCDKLEREGPADCLRAQPAFAPVCEPGFAPAFATLRCRRLCDVDRPCGPSEQCVPWQGSAACLEQKLLSP